MLWIDQDPTNVPCPDFAGATYAAIRQVMLTNRQITNEQAVEHLTAVWNQTHAQDIKAWNLQVQADKVEQEEFTRLAEEEEVRHQAEDKNEKEEERKEQEKKQLKINDFDESKMVADHVMPQPSQFAIGKLKSFSFVKMWYFTDEGCTEAQVSSRAQSDDDACCTGMNVKSVKHAKQGSSASGKTLNT